MWAMVSRASFHQRPCQEDYLSVLCGHSATKEHKVRREIKYIYANHNVTALVGYNSELYEWQVVERYVYDPYGKTTVYDDNWSNPTSPTTDGPLYCGYWFDAETGLYQVRNRYYNSILATFISRDPLMYKAKDMNLYRYCGNDPTDKTDPSGLDPLGDYAAIECAWACMGHWGEAQKAAYDCQTIARTEADRINPDRNSAENIELRHCIGAGCLAQKVGCSCASCLGWAREQYQYLTGANTRDAAKRGNCNNQQGLSAAGCSGKYGNSGSPNSDSITQNCKKRRCEGKMTGKGEDCGTSQIREPDNTYWPTTI